MAEAEITWVSIEANRYNPEQTQLSIGFKIDGEVSYMRYTLAGGTEGQQKFASLQLSKLLKQATYKVNVEKNDRGYLDVYADDGFRSGGGDADGF
jgi:hypothetical protein